jgi:putative transposase
LWRPPWKGIRGQFRRQRYDDFNDHAELKRVEKLRYLDRNLVRRGLVEKPEDWPWSSFVRSATGAIGTVEIDSEWTARLRGPLIAIKLR